ncbi:MAG: BamA/TamA family outer membrane protein [Gemmatimonadota bacterium]|jgi:outer membrane protein insertion porin family/translocation and assembly module TamA
MGRGILERLVWTVGLLALAGPMPLSGQSTLLEVTDLRFVGNEEYSGEALSRAIVTRKTECRSVLFQIVPLCAAGFDFSLSRNYLNERILREDYARVYAFYLRRGFRDVQVDTLITRPSEDEIEITFQIQEGEPIRIANLEFQGLETLSDSSVVDNLPIREGDPLSLPDLHAARDSVENRLKNMGYYNPFVSPYSRISRGSYEGQVSFEIDPGPLFRFGNLEVEFRVTQDEEPSLTGEEVLRLLPFQEGDLYGEDLQLEGRRALYGLDLFTQVDDTVTSIRAGPTPADSVLDLRIRVAEGDVHRVRTGGGYSTAQCADLQASWSSLNFMGGARRLQLSARVANLGASSPFGAVLCFDRAEEEEYRRPIGSVSIDFTQPWFFSPKNSISARLYVDRQSYPDAFIREGVGITLGFTRTLAPSTFLGFSYRPQRSKLKLTEVLFCSAYLICDRTEIDVLKENNFLSPLGISFSLDRRNQFLNPTQGYSLAADFEHARKWTGSEFSYSRILSEATLYRQLPRDLIFGTHLRAGWIRSSGFKSFGSGGVSLDILHPEKRLFSGGASSVRGFAQNRLGPRVLYLDDPKPLYKGSEDDPFDSYCTIQEMLDGSCDANPLGDQYFQPRPKGGNRVLEGSVEVRFPLGGSRWEGATFVDVGQVWDEESDIDLGKMEFTPGFGVRYFSPIGPVRVDLGYRFRGEEELQVVTRKLVKNEDGRYEPGDELIRLGPRVLFGEKLARWHISRFQLHLSIGQAF